jgi:hypothetical protein
VGVVLVLAVSGVFYAVGRSEDRERAREARSPTQKPPRRRPTVRRRDHE